MEQTTARLRKTFHYPADNDSDDSLPEALDEEEQESLIRTLHQQNASLNLLYTRLLLALPALSILPYLRSLVTTTAATALPSLLAISSLLSTAYLLHALPPGRTGITLLDSHSRNGPPPQPNLRVASSTWRVHDDDDGGGGPIERFLPLLNLGLVGVLGLLGMLTKGGGNGGDGRELWVGFAWLPGVVYAVVLVAEVVMGSVDPEGELGALKYGFKGA